MGTRTGVLAAALAVGVVAIGAGGCSGDDGPPGPGSRSAVLVERLGCDAGIFGADAGEDWFAVDMRDCREGPVHARVYGSLSSEDHDAAVRALTEGADPGSGMRDWCAENTGGEDLYLVTGDAWVAVVVGEADAATAADRLDGERRGDPLPQGAATGEAPLLCLPAGDLG